MQTTSGQRFCGVETLEDRRLMSATIFHPARPAPFPHLTGEYVGPISFSTGAVDTVTLFIEQQHNGFFAGIGYQATGNEFSFRGNITRKGAFTINTRGTNVKLTSVSKGTFSDLHLRFKFNTLEGKLRFRGTGDVAEIINIP